MKTIVITAPGEVKDEAARCNLLFAAGLDALHLRKPGASAEAYEAFICAIDPAFRPRVVIHDHYELAERYGLGGIHLRAGRAADAAAWPHERVSISCHSVEEIQALPFRPAYCFLSPVFDSISKPGYTAAFPRLPEVGGLGTPVVALGGITPERVAACREAGFAGVAALGYIWEKPEEAVGRFRRLRTPFVMSIAGFDPSSGAGVTADIKTFEATGSYGLGVCSALTFQNEHRYMDTRWMNVEDIYSQCTATFELHRPEYIKIGLIESFDVVKELATRLSAQSPRPKIIWDPILRASAGKVFHRPAGEAEELLKDIYLLTPNTEEVRLLFGENATPESLQALCRRYDTRILWKGGHDEGATAVDRLITAEGIRSYAVTRSTRSKHGTGCALSAAIVSALAQGDDLDTACNKAQLYVAGFIDSNDSRLGYHFMDAPERRRKPSIAGLRMQYITAPKDGMTPAAQAEAVCRGGMRWVQLRMKEATTAEMLAEGRLVKEICHRHGALFIVNDRVQVARELDADGVHLGKEDMDPREARALLGEEKIIGATCNTWEDILLRQQQGVDYIGLGPFTFTTTKEKLSPVLGLEGYRHLLEQMRAHGIRIPVYAIGGITEADIPPLMQTGIAGIALSGLLRNSPDLTRKTAETEYILKQLP